MRRGGFRRRCGRPAVAEPGRSSPMRGRAGGHQDPSRPISASHERLVGSCWTPHGRCYTRRKLQGGCSNNSTLAQLRYVGQWGCRKQVMRSTRRNDGLPRRTSSIRFVGRSFGVARHLEFIRKADLRAALAEQRFSARTSARGLGHSRAPSASASISCIERQVQRSANPDLVGVGFSNPVNTSWKHRVNTVAGLGICHCVLPGAGLEEP